MKCLVGFYTLTAWMLCISMTVTGKSTADCDDKYDHLASSCESVCSKKGFGLHQTFSCHHYCFCHSDSGPGKHRTCPDGMVFNHLIENCDYPQNYKCPERPPLPANYKCPSSTGIFDYPGCCRLLIICDHHKPHVFFCPSILHFSPRTNGCDYPGLLGCSSKYPVDTSVTTTTTTTLPPPVIGPAEICKRDDYYPHQNCSRFYHCSHGKAYLNICPANLHWNVENTTCDYQCNAKCDKNVKCPNA